MRDLRFLPVVVVEVLVLSAAPVPVTLLPGPAGGNGTGSQKPGIVHVGSVLKSGKSFCGSYHRRSYSSGSQFRIVPQGFTF